MAVLDLGDPWAEYLYVRDINGALANAGALTCTVTFPDQTTTQAATITGPSPTGTYLASLAATVPTQVGRYTWYGQATGANACSMSGAFEVRSSTSTALFSLDDAKGVLNWPAGDLSQDEEIRDAVDVVTSFLEKRIGTILQQTLTETVEIWRDFFYTRQPIVSLTSLTPVRSGGMTLLAADYQVLSNGKVVRKDGAWVTTAPWNLYTAVYVAGRTTVSPKILGAARALLQHFWAATQRSDFGTPSLGSDDAINVDRLLTPLADELLFGEGSVGIA